MEQFDWMAFQERQATELRKQKWRPWIAHVLAVPPAAEGEYTRMVPVYQPTAWDGYRDRRPKSEEG